MVTVTVMVIIINSAYFNILYVTIFIIGYWHQRDDERHGNPPPR